MGNRVRRGEIYWIDPTIDATEDTGCIQKAGRPGIIVSNDENNKYSSTVEVVFLTTQPKTDLPTHCTINSARDPSTALCEQIQTVNYDQIQKYAGTCTSKEMASVDRCIAISIGLATDPPVIPQDSDPIIDELRIALSNSRAREEVYKTMYQGLIDKLTCK